MEDRLCVVGNRVLRRTFRPKEGRGWVVLVHVARMGEKGNVCRVFCGKYETQHMITHDNIELDYCICTVHLIRSLNCQYQHMHNFNVTG